MRFFPQNLRYLRKLAGLSQQALAKNVDLNRGNIASYEKGAAEPNIANLLKITRFFKVDLVDFLDRDLSESQIEEKIKVNGNASNGVNIQVEKETLKDLFDEHFSNDDSLNSTQIFGERLMNLLKILNGFREYHRFRVSKYKDPSPEMQAFFLDYERSLDITEEAIDIGRQLLRKYLELTETPK